MKKTLVCGLWSVVCGLIFISGCGRKAPESVTPQKRIVLWHWLSDREEVLKTLAKKYQALTGVQVKCDLYAPSDAYSQKIMAAGQARALPDIFGILGEKRIFAAFIKAGHITDITSEMGKGNGAWKNVFFEKALQVNEFLPGNKYGIKPGIYGVPIDVMNIQMLYNKRLFQQAGLDPRMSPQTWEEFIRMLEKLKQAGIKGLVSGFGESWMVDSFAHDYAFNIMGKEKIIDTINGKIPYNDPGWIRVFKLFNELARKQLFLSGVVTMGNKTAEQLFANERAAFAFNGSWCVNVYESMNPNLEYGAILPPRMVNNNPMTIWGGAGTSFMVNGRSQNKEDAIKFLKWLTSKDQQAYLVAKTWNLPANKNSLENIPEILSEFGDDMDNITHPNLLPVQESPRVLEALAKGIQAVIIGVKTPEQIADEIQAVKLDTMNENN